VASDQVAAPNQIPQLVSVQESRMANVVRGHEEVPTPVAFLEKGRNDIPSTYTTIVKREKQGLCGFPWLDLFGNGYLRSPTHRFDGIEVALKRRRRKLVESCCRATETAEIDVAVHNVVVHQ
jgi:hypothetical protein